MAETTTTKPKTARTWTSARLACGPSLGLAGQEAERDEHGGAGGDRAQWTGPADQEVEHGRDQRDCGRQAHPDAEPLQPLAVVPDRPDVAAAHRSDRQDARRSTS